MDYNSREHIGSSPSNTSFLREGYALQPLSFSVICVDDEPSLLATIKLFLEKKGIFTVDTTTNAKDALAKIKLHKYDVVVSDYQMPEMDGIQFLKELRGAGNTIPFIIFTGKGHENVVIEAYNAGAEFYLQKGGDSRAMLLDLMNKIKQVVTHRRTDEALLENEERYRKVVEQSHDVIYIYQGTKFIFVNDRATEITGYSKKELYDMNFRDLVHPDDQEYVIEISRDGVTGGDASQTYEIRIITKTGDVRYLDLAVSSLIYKGENAVLGSARDITERKRAEDELRKSEEKYRSIFNTFDDLYYQTDIQGIIKILSPSCKKITGWDPSELIGLSVLDLYPFPEQREKLLDELFKNGAVNDYEIILRNKEGKHLTVSVTSHLVRDERGNPSGIEGTLRNITERKQVEKAFHESEKRYRTLADFLPVVVFETTSDGKLTFTNRLAYTTFSIDLADVEAGINIIDYIVPEERNTAKENILKLFRGEPRESNEYTLMRNDGSRFPAMISASTIYDEREGTPVGMRGVIIDLTERKHAEEAIRESTERFRNLVETTSDMVWEVDPNGVYTYISPKIRDLLGYEPDEIIGKTPFDLMPPDEAKRVSALFENLVSKGKPIKTLENINLHKDGRCVVLETNGEPVFNSEGILKGYRGIDRDITYRKRAEEEERYEIDLSLRTRDALLQISKLPIDSLELFLSRISEIDSDAIDISRVSIWFYSEDLSEILCSEAYDRGSASHTRGDRLKREDYPRYFAALDEDMIIDANNARTDPRTSEFTEGYLNVHNIVSMLDVPIRRGGRVIGIVCHEQIGSTPRAWSHLEKDFAASVADMIVTALEGRERKQAEKALRESEELFRTLFDNANDAIFLHEMQPDGRPGRYIKVNDVACKYLGYTQEELLTMTPSDISSPGHRLNIPEISRTIKMEGHATFEAIHQRKDGSEFPVEISTHLFELHTKILSLSIARDITERKQMEDAIRTNKQQLHAIIDGSSIPMFVISDDHKILYWNKALEFYTGLKAADMIGTARHWSAFYPTERPCMADLLVDDDHYRIPTLYSGKYRESRLLDGAYEAIDFFPHIGGKEGTWMLFTAVAIKDEKGNMIGALETLQDISIQKQIEEALRTSEQQYRSVVEDQTEFICRFRPDGTLTFVNDAYCRYFGLSKDECIGKKHDVSLYPEDIHLMNIHLAALTPENSNTIIEHRIIMPSGEVRWQRWSDRAIFDGAGRVLEYQSVGRDITEKREGEEKLKNSEKYLKTIFNSVQTGLVIINPITHTIHDANPAAVKLIGTDINNIIGKPCHNFICPAETGKCPITDLGKKIENSERILLTADGKRIPILKTVIPATFSGSQYLLESFLDITDRKRAEDARQKAYAELETKVAERTAKLSMLTRDLQKEIAERNRVMEALQVSEQKYRGLVEQTSDIVFHIDPSGIISYCSPNVQAILGYTPEETVGKPLVEFMTPAEAERFARIHNQNISLKRSVTDIELTILDKIKNPRIFEVSGNPSYDKTGTFNGFSGIARDITERKHMQEEITASLMEKETMIKEIHHRVKNNMQVISSLLNLQVKLIKDEKSREVILESQNRVRSIALVHEKLYQSKNLSRINFQDYLLKMADYLFQSYGINPNSIRLKIDAENMFLPIDKAIPISLIVNELLSNSLKYAFPDKREGTISITMRRDGPTYILNVRDDGIGLPDGFDLNRSDTLGLQLVNALVEQIQGTIELKREKGTMFEIIFMIEQKEGEHYE